MRLGASILALLLGGCSTIPAPSTPTHPPIDAIQECPLPEADLSSNGALANTYKLTRQALVECNIDKAILREWDAGLEKGTNVSRPRTP